MRGYRALRALALRVREWWRRQHDVPRQVDPVREVIARFDPDQLARDMARLIRMQNSASNHKPVKPIGRVA